MPASSGVDAALGFAGRIAFITGAGAGIGAAIARRLAAGGATVIVSDRDAAAAETVAVALGGGAHAMTLDVSDEPAVAAQIAAIVERFGRLDLAVNNAGIGETPRDTAERSAAGWRRVMAVNLDGTFYCMKHEIAAMQAGGGAIVNIASVLGRNGFAGAAAYVAAKHGVIGLTKAAAIEYAARHIRINAVAPAFIATDTLRASYDGGRYAALVARHPIGRLGTPEDVAEMTAFLLSDRAAFVTGSCHLVDGGYDAQ